MTTATQSHVSIEAKRIFQSVKDSLEVSHANQFVAVEPLSEELFFGNTLSDAIGSARTAYPDRLVHAFRIGHNAAIHLG